MLSLRTIWIIVALMVAALLGIMWLQFNWLNSNLELNRKKLDSNVFSALNRVAEKLQYLDDSESPFDLIEEGFSREDILRKFVEEGGDLKEILGDSLNINISGTDDPMDYATNQILLERYSTLLLFEERDISERINLEFLDKALSSELKNRGLGSDYEYAVYSNKDEGFVIMNGHYVFPEKLNPENPMVVAVKEDRSAIENTQFRVDLFASGGNSPGMLLLSIPDTYGLVLADIWIPLMMTIGFIGLMLFSFIFVVKTIFRQKRISEMKTDFINNMTHEFKTPIATISLASDSITSDMVLSDTNKVRKFAEIIKQENKRMHSQVEKVLQMALIDKKNFELKITDVNLHDVIQQIVSNVRLIVQKREGSVSMNLDARDPYIKGDLTHLQNIIYNLLDNANKYSPENPIIDISTRNVKEGIEFTVSDNGIGMSKEARKHIFDKFFRISTGDLHDIKGFGLGLSYVKAIVTAHKGEIKVESEPGKGSSFSVFLPYNS